MCPDESPTSDLADVPRTGLFNARAPGELERAPPPVVAGELVAAITHDLRQPLTAVEMNLSAAILLLTQPTPLIEEAIEALKDALGQERRMRDALQVLQDLAVRREPQRESLDVVAMVREVVSLVNSDAMARHVPIEVELDSTVPSISGDALLVRQALVNILLEALEATSLSPHTKGPIRVTVRALASTSVALQTDFDATEVSVTHFGPGGTEAAGLDHSGLALARSVVNAHGATIAFEGDPARGMAVVTRWPVRSPEAPRQSSPNA